jgi:hypothetical protein
MTLQDIRSRVPNVTTIIVTGERDGDTITWSAEWPDLNWVMCGADLQDSLDMVDEAIDLTMSGWPDHWAMDLNEWTGL